jgi:uncharacterized protein
MGDAFNPDGKPRMFHAGSRAMQDEFDTRPLADRVVEFLGRDHFNDDDRAFIETRPMFFLATADDQGRPECSFKGGAPGFVRVIDDHTLAFPSYDGNGMFMSLGNVRVNPAVGLLFIDFVERPRRLRVNGQATVDANDPLLDTFPGAQLIVRVKAEAVFPNCSRYLPRMAEVEPSKYIPCEGYEPPEPKWKQMPEFQDVLPPKPDTP